MIQENFFSNNFDKDYNINDDDSSLFFMNQNNDNFWFKLDNNAFQFQNNIFCQNSLDKELSQISPIPISNLGNDSESDKQQININICISNDNSNSFATKEKSQLKKIEKNKNEINIINNKINPILNLDEDNDITNIDNNNSNNNNNNNLLTKKRRPRIHLEDLNIDPEIIKEKKFLIIGDKVILSKNQIITEEDKKEIRAIRNRKSAKKSRDRKKVEYINLVQKIELLKKQIEEKNIIINNYEKISCIQCKRKMAEFSKILLKKDNIKNNIPLALEYKEKKIINNKNGECIKNEKLLKDENKKNNEKEELILEEKESFFSDKKNPFNGKIS